MWTWHVHIMHSKDASIKKKSCSVPELHRCASLPGEEHKLERNSCLSILHAHNTEVLQQNTCKFGRVNWCFDVPKNLCTPRTYRCRLISQVWNLAHINGVPHIASPLKIVTTYSSFWWPPSAIWVTGIPKTCWMLETVLVHERSSQHFHPDCCLTFLRHLTILKKYHQPHSNSEMCVCSYHNVDLRENYM